MKHPPVTGARLACAVAVSVLLAACSGDPQARSTADAGGHVDAAPAQIPEDVRRALSALALAEVPPPPPDVSNRFADDPRAATFGQRLFYDPSFSGELLDGDNDGSSRALGRRGDVGKVACSGCHIAEAGFVDTRTIGQQISLGAGWVLRRTPSVLDVSRGKLLTWGGRHDALYNQPLGPIESPIEMNSSRLFVAQQMYRLHRDEYEGVFGPLPPLDDATRFPPLSAEETGCERLGGDNGCVGVMRGAPGDGAEFDGLAPEDKDAVTRVVVNMGKALGAYQRLLSCGTSRFDAWMGGDEEAMSDAEKRGAVLFVTKGDCVRCHSGPFFSDEQFHNVGLKPEVVATVFIALNDQGAATGLEGLLSDPLSTRGEYSDGDDGRVPGAVLPEHLGAFKTPRLRCTSRQPSFMHTGHLRSLDDVVAFFARGGDRAGFPGRSEISPLDLTLEERGDLVAFLKALDGDGPPAELLGPPR